MSRLRALEERDREQATAEVRRAWERLSDEEMALLLEPFHLSQEPTLTQAAAQAEFRETVPEALIARAIGYTEEMSGDEVGRRVQELLAPAIERRRPALSRRLREVG